LEDVRLEARGEVFDGAEVDFAVEEVFEFVLHADEFEEADLVIGGEFDEEVDVGLVGEIVTEDGTEEGEFLDGVAPAELEDFFEREGKGE